MESLSLLLNVPEPIVLPQRRHSSVMSLIWRRRRIGFAVFMVMMLGTALCVYLLPTYQAAMQIMVHNDRVNSPVASDNSTQAVLNMNDISEDQVNTEVALLTSNDLMLELVRKAGLARPGDSSESQDRNEQIALRELKAHLEVTPLRKSAIIDVRYRSDNRESAVRVLTVLSTLYFDAESRLQGVPGAYDVFEKLWEDAFTRRANAEAALSEFKRAHNIAALPDEKAIALQIESDLEREYAEASVAAARSNNQTQALEQIVERTPLNIVGERKSLPNQSEVENLGSVLSGLQLKRIEASSRYLPSDRIITDLDQQIASTKSALESASSQKAEELSMVSNPVLQQAETELVQSRGESAGYQEQATQLRQKLAASRLRLAALDGETATYSQLADDVTRFSQLQTLYRQKADTASAEKALNENHVSNVNLSEMPFAPSQRSPHVWVICVLGTICSLVSSVFVILVVDRMRARVTSPYETSLAIGAPVVALLGAETSAEHPFGYLPAAYAHLLGDSPQQSWRRL